MNRKEEKKIAVVVAMELRRPRLADGRSDVSQLERLLEIANILEKWEDQEGANDEEKQALHFERKVLREQLIVLWGYADRTRVNSFVLPNKPSDEHWVCELCFTDNGSGIQRCESCGCARRISSATFRSEVARKGEAEPLSAEKRHHNFEPTFFPQPIFCKFCHTFIR